MIYFTKMKDLIRKFTCVLLLFMLFSSVTLAEDVSGHINFEGKTQELSQNQLESIKNYYTTLFDSLAELEEKDITEHFYQKEINAYLAGIYEQTYLNVLVALRKNQPTDLRLKSYDINLDITDVTKVEDNVFLVTINERDDLVFNQTPNIDSITQNIANVFRLEYLDGKWYITRHEREEDIHYLISEYLEADNVGLENREQYLKDLEAALIQRGKDEIALQKEARIVNREQVNTQSKDIGGYNRNEAVNYANTWYATTNPAYEYYGNVGGNCNNFISQALAAGGIEYDLTGDERWYSNITYGSPSYSWVLVDQFYDYAVNNQEGGFKASVTDSLYAGKEGDILQFGENNDWKHSVIITGLVKDEDGNTIDYLIDSNTSDRQNFPASAYGYPQLRLIRILGK